MSEQKEVYRVAGKPILSKVLPVNLTNRNDGQGRHWGRTAKAKNDIATLLGNAGFERGFPFRFLVDVQVTRILGPKQRKYDADSVGRGNAKQLIDVLVDLNWFEDDGPKWIRNCDFRQDDTRRGEGPAVLVEVYEVKE